MNIIEFLKINYYWIAPIVMALAAIITAFAKFMKKGGKNHKQKIGDIKDSTVININGDFPKSR